MPDPRTPPATAADTRPDLPTRPVAAAPTRLPRAGHEIRRRHGKPDATSIRMVLKLAKLASASALATAMLPSILPPSAIITNINATTQQPEPSVIHVTHVVQLAPGQTLPPDAAANLLPGAAAPAQATPRPTPRVIIQTITRQSGKP